MNKSDIMSRSVTVSSVGAATAAAAVATKSSIVRSTTSKLMKSSPLFSLVTGMNYTKDIFDASTVFTGILPKESLIMRNTTSKVPCEKQNNWIKTESDDTDLTSDTPGYRRYEIGSNSTSIVTANTSVVRSLIFGACGNLNATSQEKTTAVPTYHAPTIVPGLPNLGNTCFVNALLQALASLDLFNRFLDNLNTKLEDNETARNQICTSIDLIRALHRCMQVLREVTVSPRTIDKSIVGAIMRPLREGNASFSGYDQQDAEELLQSLMSEVDEALHVLNAPPPRVSTGLASFLSPHTDLEAGIESRDNLKNPLQGLVASILDCKNCHRRSPTRNVVFHDIAVSLTQHLKQALTVHRCLSSYFMRETIDDVECTGCKSRQPAEKRLLLSRLPKCLCIHFRRRIYTEEGPCKVRTRVKFAKVLDMTSYFAHSNFRDLAHVDKDSCTESATTSCLSTRCGASTHTKQRHLSAVSVAPLLYSLTAVIVHHGTANSGHFVAYRRLARDVWIEASDAQVKRVDESRVLNTEAYMLFYAQQDAS